MISIDQALALYAARIAPLPPVTLPLAPALGRVLAVAPTARIDLPRFTQSAVDGYALCSVEVAAASAAAPVTLALVGEVAAGTAALPSVRPGTAVRIFTGGALPPGADTVARQEIVQRLGERIVLAQPLAVHCDTRLRGEELRAGAVLAATGQRLTPGLTAVLAMAGVAAVTVHRAPRIALLVTGDEVTHGLAAEALQPGQIFDSNGPLLQAWFAHRRCTALAIRHVPDRLDALQQALQTALAEADLVITTGGVSVGERDYVREAAAALGVAEVFWRVAQKPGMPLYFGVRGAQAVLGLPGNPGAVLAGLEVHAARVLALLEGEASPGPHWRIGRLAAAVKGDAQRELLLRMRVQHDAAGIARLQPLGRQGSHMLSNLAEANAIVRMAGAALPADALVPWLPLDGS